jgi:acetoin utilization deacetylase AcuC-like enzyme
MLQHPHSPEVPERLICINEAMDHTGLAKSVTPLEFLADPFPHVGAVHTEKHIASIEAIPKTGEAARLAIAGLLGAVKAVHEGAVRNAFCAIRPPGHHAHNSGREEGFCFYSNVAIAAIYAQSLGYSRILIVDWDYHHGNGTQDVFYDDPSVLFCSTHDQYTYPGTGDPGLTGQGDGEGYNLNVHLDCGATDSDFLAAFENKIIPLADGFKPDFVLISAGFDSRKHDLLGCFEITDSGFAQATAKLMELADTHCGGRIVSALEGGYRVEDEVIAGGQEAGKHTGTIADAVTAHVSTLMGMEQPITAVADRDAGQHGGPGVERGVLKLGLVDPRSVRRVCVVDSRGRVVRRVPRSWWHSGGIDTRKLRLAAGHYQVRLEMHNGAACVVSLPSTM